MVFMLAATACSAPAASTPAPRSSDSKKKRHTSCTQSM
jgi:hypothetical protein